MSDYFFEGEMKMNELFQSALARLIDSLQGSETTVSLMQWRAADADAAQLPDGLWLMVTCQKLRAAGFHVESVVNRPAGVYNDIIVDFLVHPQSSPQAKKAAEATYQHMLGKTRDAARGGERAWGPMSTGEKLAAAIVLNRPDWLKEMDYTIAEAADRVGESWMRLVPRVTDQLRAEGLLH